MMRPSVFHAAAATVRRQAELAQLSDALATAAAGARRVMLVAGSAGVGKSSLMRQLRPMARARGGRFVSGKFDQRNEREATAVVEALGALGRQLLRDAAEERAETRSRILRTLGGSAALACVVPELAQLLGELPDARQVDPAQAASRMAEVVAGLLRACASSARPLVLVLDDLQWGGALSTRLIDAVLAAPDIRGLLLVAAFRDDELAADHPLAAALHRWAGEGEAPQWLRVCNLRPAQTAQLLAQCAAVPVMRARGLARLITPHSHGNPYDTLEFLQALIDEALIERSPRGLRWDSESVRAALARSTVMDLLAGRIARLPPQARELLQALACIGAQTGADQARAASVLPPAQFEEALALLREQGFVLQGRNGALHLRHDRVQQAACASVPPERRAGFHFALAGRLAQHDAWLDLAADQYVLAVDEVKDTAFAAPTIALLRRAAAQQRQLGHHNAACRMLQAAMLLLEGEPAPGGADPAAVAECEFEYHLALCNVGRLDEADAVYRRIEGRCSDPLRLIDAACVQVGSLTNRDRVDEALDLGLGLLRSLGLQPPDRAARATILPIGSSTCATGSNPSTWLLSATEPRPCPPAWWPRPR